MEKISKYILLAFLISNLAAQFIPLVFMADTLFYGSLAIGMICLLFSPRSLWGRRRIISSSFLWMCSTIYICYQLTFGLMNMTIESWQYLFAKILVLFLIYLGVQKNYEFYYTTLIPILSIIIAIMIVYGTLFSNLMVNGRFTCGFGNPNSTSAISVIGFGGFLLTKRYFSYIKIIGAMICLYGTMAGGSRTSFVMCIIALLLKYRLSLKTVGLILLTSFFILFVLPYFGFRTNAVDRIIDVIEKGNFVGSRKAVREATMMMIQQQPIIGWGYKSGIQGMAAKISNMGSHNGYLDTIKAIGLFYATLLFGYMAYTLSKIKILFKEMEDDTKFHLFIIISVLLAAMYESYIIGINQIITNMLFLSIGLLEYKIYHLYEKRDD